MSEEQDNNQEQDWKEGLPSELAGHPSLADVKDVAGLAKQFIDAKAYQGSSVRIPTEDEGEDVKSAAMQKIVEKVPGLTFKPDMSDPDSVKNLFKTLGTPDEPDEYKIPEVDGVPFEDELAKSYKQMAHKNGLTVKQFEGLMNDILEGDKAAIEANNKLNEDDRAALKREWGNATDEKVQQIARFAEKAGAPTGLAKMLQEGTAGSDVYKMFDNIISKMGKEGNELTRQLPTVTGRTVEQIEDEMAGIRNNPDMWDSSNPNFKRLNAKLLGLHKELSAIRSTKNN